MKALHHITYNGIGIIGTVLYDMKPVKMTATKEVIQINCTTISVTCLEAILSIHKNKFPNNNEIILQSGEEQQMGTKY